MSIRKPETVEILYLDFDGFFASVEQQARPALRGRPVGVVPFDTTDFTCVIACSKEAKQFGVKSVMPIREAKGICPELVLVPQSPDLYRRAHHALINEIMSVVPIDAIKSIDELTCRLDKKNQKDPKGLAVKIKQRINDHIGSFITCSIGLAANRQLAKIACKMDKPNGITIWEPKDMPAPLLEVPFDDIPGIGSRMSDRLHRAGIFNVEQLLKTSPKHMRQIWRNVTGERLWYALQGYEVRAQPSQRGMFGHSRVLPPQNRNKSDAQACARLLLVKAARRMRREGFYATKLWLHFSVRLKRKEGRGLSGDIGFPACQDDQAVLAALGELWEKMSGRVPPGARILRIGVALYDLEKSSGRQLDLFIRDDAIRQKWENVNKAIDAINMKYGATVVSVGSWKPPAGGYAGGKIAYTRIPSAEDFW